MSYHINPGIGTDYASQISESLFWYKDKLLTITANTKLDGDKKKINDVTVYAIRNIVSEFNYYILVNDKHELLFDTTDFNEMYFYIDQLKNS